MNTRCVKIATALLSFLCLICAISASVWEMKANSNLQSTIEIRCGGIITSEISSPGERDSYTFSGAANDKVIVTAYASGAMCARAEIYDPSGRLIGNNTCDSSTGVIALPVAGVYTIQVFDFGLTSVGAYGLSLHFTNGKCGIPIVCGQTTGGALNAVAERNVYTFSGNAGDKIIVSAYASGAMCARAEVYDPSGALVGNNTCDSSTGVLTLPSNGAYTILVSDFGFASTGGFGLSLQFTNGSCGDSIACGQTASRSIGSVAERHAYRFNGSAGDKVTFSAYASGAMCARAELYSPSGALVGNNTCDSSSGLLTLPASGVYTILVSDFGLASTGGYGLSLQFTNGRCGRPIACGQTINGEITTVAQRDVFTFCGVAGSSVVISANAPGALCARVELYDPSGNPLGNNTCDSSTGSVSLPATGAYTILVSDFGLASAGQYGLNLSCIGAVCPASTLALTPNPLNITAGASGNLTAIINPTQSAPTIVTLSSSNTSIATVPASVTISANAASVSFPVTGVSAGSATITATAPTSATATASVTVTAGTGSAQIEITPAAPTTADNVSIRIFGDWPNACAPQNPQLTRAGAEIRIATTNPGQFCPQVITPWSHTVPIGQLAAGTYQVIVTFNGREIGRRSFTVTSVTREVRVVSAEGSPGGSVSVPIELVSPGDVTALGFSLTFNPAILSNPQATPDSGATLNDNTSQVGQGRFGMAISLGAGQTFPVGVRRVATVTFTIAAGPAVSSTQIGFADQPIARGVVGVSANPLPAVFTPGPVTIIGGLEADVAPRPGGNDAVTISDWVQVGRFAAGLDMTAPGVEFQRADCAPRLAPDGVTLARGDGRVTISDWVQAGRYAAGQDPPTPAGGPTSPSSTLTAAIHSDPAVFAATASDRILRVTSAATDSESETLSIMLDAQGAERAIGFSLRFDPTSWRFDSAIAGSDAAEALIHVNAGVNAGQSASGRIGVALALPAGQTLAAGAREFARVRFVPVSPSTENSIAVAFDDLPVAREAADANANVLQLRYAVNTRELGAVTVVSAASFDETPLAVESIATAFGVELAFATQEAATAPLELAGTKVVIRDSAGVDHPAPLLFVSPTQINFLVPAGATTGIATVVITNRDGAVATGTMQVATVSPFEPTSGTETANGTAKTPRAPVHGARPMRRSRF